MGLEVGRWSSIFVLTLSYSARGVNNKSHAIDIRLVYIHVGVDDSSSNDERMKTFEDMTCHDMTCMSCHNMT